MSDTPPDYSAAAEAAGDITPQAPPPPPPEPELPEVPEGQDTFDRDYVEKLRGEAAKYRTRAREIESKFEGYSDAEKERFLDLAHQLHTNPEAAYEEFAAVTQRLATMVGKEQTVTEEAAPEPAPEPEPAPAAQSALSAADVERLVSERIEAERQAQAKQDEVAQIFNEAEGLGADYGTQSGKAYLLALAREFNTDLAGAHAINEGLKEQIKAQAIEEYREALKGGQTPSHPPRLPAGDATAPAAAGPPKTLAEARARMEERLNATYGE